VAIRELDSGIIRKLPEIEGKGNGIVSDEKAAQSLLDLQKTKMKNTKILNVDEERGEDVSNTVALEERTVELDEGQAGSDPGNTPESRPPLERESIKEDQAGPNPGQSHHTTEEQVLIENPPSSTMTLSSLKNLEDTFTFGDQFLNDKPMKDEPGKANVETEVESMVTVPIHQASSSVPPLFTPIINLTPPKPISPLVQEPIFTAITTNSTTTLPLPPPPPQQSTTVPDLATRVSSLKKICANFKKKNKLQDKTTQALSSRVYTLENHDLYSKIDKYVNEVVKDFDQSKKKGHDSDASASKQHPVQKSS
ncbi:hypothetical protein Tco_0062062, partial [Tanacetum coccineum]